jgi:hypothetical protein
LGDRAAQRIAAMRAKDSKDVGSEVELTQARLEEISEDDIFELRFCLKGTVG